MKISKRQLRRIIKEEKRQILELGTSRGEGPPYPGNPDVELLWGDVEGALNNLMVILQQMRSLDPEASKEAARYVADEIHNWK